MGTINFDLLEDLNKNDVADLYLRYSEVFNQKQILNSGEKERSYLNGDFDEDEWILNKDTTDTNVFIDFTKYDKLRFKGLRDKDKIIIKLWTAEMLTREDFLSASTVSYRVNTLYEIMEETNCLSEELLEQGGNPLEDWKDNSTRGVKGIATGIYGLIDYLEYRNEYLEELDDNLDNYLNLAKKVSKKISIEDKPRNLPKSKDITAFSYYIEKFFNENKDLDLEIFYYPILIWWKVTNVIPMRISELCKKLTRDCLIYEDERIFLKIDRVKKKRDTRRHHLPILDKIEINSETADMIEHYIKLTEHFGKTNTLFSYRAYNKIKSILNKKYENISIKTTTNRKNNEDNFSHTIFDTLLDSFYDYVIKNLYKDSMIETRVKPTDTRHFAFFSLMLQGLSPIEIALLGGHTTIKAQENYEYEVIYYMDSELYKLLGKNRTSKVDKNENNRKSIKEIISNMPEEPPKSLLECRELKVGYCTFDYENGEDACEDFDDCCFCSKFWCAPTAENYKKKLQMISKRTLSMIHNDLIKNANFLSDLISDIKLNSIQCRDGIDVCMDRNDLIKIRTTCNKIKHDTECINKLRYSIIDLDQVDNKLESVIKSIENTVSIE